MSSTIRAIVVDDEELARRGIELRLQSHPDIELIAQCVNGREALSVIDAEQPDLMFLDIQMPGLSGFDVLARVPQESMPMIVFVTAYDRYALDAFEAHALDYLLKPINDARFAQALDRVREHWAQRNALAQREKLMSLLAATRGAGSIDEQTLREQLEPVQEQRYAEILPIRDDSETVRLNVATIDWIDAAGDYMCVHAEGRTYVLRETMKSLAAILDPKIFQRVHRSTIVNVKRVRRLRPHTNGEYFLTLEDGQEIKLSRSYRDRVDQLLQRRP
ncbi:two-component system LytT family response regulator [Povalibacter uvarum]|uniref:Two-component system LytT family response regulator n=1 Tax=Povalibacter uvarum TaxID=732238 RepID=A0A841HKS3_9GAMM|nr:LytTR family DNA-binding domain-containing protein [Povalibacter uvarum]MBB6093174.1 two-component system LytT family response regulator [Povalibacter uvarum]